MTVLADALEEAGCGLPAALHCRECPAHAPGCWVLVLEESLGQEPADPFLLLPDEILVRQPMTYGQATRSVGYDLGQLILAGSAWVAFCLAVEHVSLYSVVGWAVWASRL